MTKMIATLDVLRSVETPVNTGVYQAGLPGWETLREGIYRYPSVCMVMPFNPTMQSKKELAHQLQMASAKVEWQLTNRYPGDVCTLVVPKLRSILGNVNFNTHKKSLAVFLSPVFEKVYYFHLPVQENIFVDGGFDMRSLLYCKKQTKDYLLFLPGSYDSRIYLGNQSGLMRILSNTPKVTSLPSAFQPQSESAVAIGSKRTSITTDVLRQADNLLHHVLAARALPLFVMGSSAVLARFKKMTRHSSAIIDYVPGHNEVESEEGLQEVMSAFVNNWDDVYQKDLQNKLNDAIAGNKLVTGINDVWRAAMDGSGSLLLVEKNRIYPGHPETTPPTFRQRYNAFSCIRSAEDEVIERLLTNGGDVLMVEPDLLKPYDHIALI